MTVPAAALLGLVFVVVPVRSAGRASAQGAPLLLASASATPLSIEATVVNLIDAAVTGPVVRSRLDRAPPRAEAVASLASLGAGGGQPVLPDVGVEVSSSNPPGGPARGPGLLGLPGLLLLAETPSARVARSQAGVRLEAPGVRGLLAGTGHVDAGETAVSARAVSDLPAVQLLDLQVGGLRSEIALQSRPDAEPLVTYTLTLAELRVRPHEVLGGAGGGLLLHGENVPVSDLPEQFRAEVARSNPLGGAALVSQVRLLEPRVEMSGEDIVSATGPALEAALPGVDGLGVAATVRLAVASASVPLRVAGEAQVEPPAAAPRGGATPESPPPPPPPQAPAAPPAPGSPPEPSAGVEAPQGGFDRGRRDRSVLRALSSGSQLTRVVMGAAALNAVLVVGRAAYLMARRSGGGS
ncbi:MAG TPA: hypothetical protein VHH09_00860 [Acidimicrobiales bacterium]|nr:hypothetical protein [Acidimicrobiales bacterium]